MISNRIKKQSENSLPNFLWELESIHINVPVHVKDIRQLKRTYTNGKHYVPWLSLVGIEI